jgi:hypothetical protein
LNDINEREKKNLQLIQDLKNEIRFNVNGRSEADHISIRLDTAIAAHADITESSPMVLQSDSVADIPMSSLAGSSISREHSGSK